MCFRCGLVPLRIPNSDVRVVSEKIYAADFCQSNSWLFSKLCFEQLQNFKSDFRQFENFLSC